MPLMPSWLVYFDLGHRGLTELLTHAELLVHHWPFVVRSVISIFPNIDLIFMWVEGYDFKTSDD